jgi:hypothetical protein
VDNAALSNDSCSGAVACRIRVSRSSRVLIAEKALSSMAKNKRFVTKHEPMLLSGSH